MATKKKKSASRRAPKAGSRRRSSKPAVKAASASIETVETSSNGLFFALLFVGLVGLSWLGMRSCAVKPPVPAVPAVTTAPAAAPAVAAKPAQAPAARSVAPAAAQKVAAAKAKPSARRESAGAKASASAETGAPSLTFDRGQKGAFEVRCWRSAANPAQLDVFAPRNRLVRTLKSEAGAAGWVKLEWDGKDTDGKKVPVGLYFLRPSQENEQSIRDIWVKG
jgi:uncharacterized iron-regulated membrane protein